MSKYGEGLLYDNYLILLHSVITTKTQPESLRTLKMTKEIKGGSQNG